MAKLNLHHPFAKSDGSDVFDQPKCIVSMFQLHPRMTNSQRADVASHCICGSQSGAPEDMPSHAWKFDFVFSERSIYTQKEIVPDDANFAEATAGHPVVQAIMLTKESADFTDRAWPAGMREAPLTRILPAVPSERFDKATPPIPPA